MKNTYRWIADRWVRLLLVPPWLVGIALIGAPVFVVALWVWLINKIDELNERFFSWMVEDRWLSVKMLDGAQWWTDLIEAFAKRVEKRLGVKGIARQ